MKTSINWLKHYVEIPWDAKELSSRLTGAGLEVEGIETSGTVPEGVVVGLILSREPHPNSDHMSVCRVDIGAGEPVQIVCGAPNCDAGRKAPCATIGTDFGDFRIKKSKLRGVESHGMLCSERELGLSDNHEGIMLLDTDAAPGTPFASLVAGDTVIDWEVTPNRPDWNSHVGIAREIAAQTRGELRLPAPEIVVDESHDIAEMASVEVRAPELCPRYIARVFTDVKIGPSPDWMVKELEAVGLRSINNVVDITNYVMLEFGNPLHAFDLSTIAGHSIIVRRAEDGEEITTLDGSHATLTHDQLLIADRDRGVALAGIMGGENSMIQDTTTTVLLEAATFDRSNIRLSSRKLGIASDSSYRYERGVSPEITALASERAATLLCRYAGAKQAKGVIDCYGRPWQFRELTCQVARCNAILGLELSAEEMADCFRRRGIEVLSVTPERVSVRTPGWRFDLCAEHDLWEEVAQMVGLDRIPEAGMSSRLVGSMKDDKFLPLEEMRGQLLGLGLDEMLNYTMFSEQQCLQGADVRPEELLKVSNPISAELACLRPTLLPGMIQVVAHNVARNEHDLRMFETGRVFRMVDGKMTESLQAGIIMTGCRQEGAFGAARSEMVDFYDLKGVLEGWFAARRLSAPRWEPAESASFKRGACAEWRVGKRRVAIFGQASEELVKGIRLRQPLFVALVDFEALQSLRPSALKYRALAQFPGTSRDFSFVAPSEVTHQQVVDTIGSLKMPLLEDIRLFDIFEDEKVLGKGRRSLSYSVTFRNPERTITDEEGNAMQEKIRKALVDRLHVELR